MPVRLLPLLLALPLAAQPFDAARLRTGSFDYVITDQQKEVARISIAIRQLPAGDFAFAADATATVCQHWESTATRALEPVSALLSFCKDGPSRAIFDLKYAMGRVSGLRYTGNPPARERHEVNNAIPAGTIDQRIDWAAVMAMDLSPGRRFTFNVYDPGTGISPLTGSVGEVEDVDLPAGRFPAYRVTYQMEKQGRVERYESLVSRDLPRLLWKIHFPNGTWSELLRTR